MIEINFVHLQGPLRRQAHRAHAQEQAAKLFQQDVRPQPLP